MKIDEKISDALDVAQTPEIMSDDNVPAISEETQVPAIPNEINELLEKDFDLARDNILEAIDAGKITLREITAWAAQAQNNFAYSALAAFFEKFIKANESLVNLHKTKKETAPEKKAQGNTNVLVVTTSELLRLLKLNQTNNGA